MGIWYSAFDMRRKSEKWWLVIATIEQGGILVWLKQCPGLNLSTEKIDSDTCEWDLIWKLIFAI
jgi:hypothetical protein